MTMHVPKSGTGPRSSRSSCTATCVCPFASHWRVRLTFCLTPRRPWWRHQMETISALLALCVGNSPVTGEFTSQSPVKRSFNVFFDLRLNKQLSKQSRGWWFETPSRPLWRHGNARLSSCQLMPQGINRSYKYFNDADSFSDLQCAPIHVMNIFDDADDVNTLLSDIVDCHVPVKSKFVMNNQCHIWNLSFAKASTAEIWPELNSERLVKSSRSRIGVSKIAWYRWGKKFITKCFENNRCKQDCIFGTPYRH